MHMPRKLAAGNWKMNGTSADLAEVSALAAACPDPSCDILICPPATLLSRMADASRGSSIAVGGQDCHAATSGAHTGDTAAAMLVDAGATHVILGHSERRTDHGETDAAVCAKAAAAIDGGLITIVCVGETLEEREEGQTLTVIGRQVAGSIPAGATAANTVIAYEPVWAIGTGKVATLEQIGEVHDFIRAELTGKVEHPDQVRILYGGSVKPDNAAAIFGVSNVDGALVGGASLKAADFAPIIRALEAAS